MAFDMESTGVDPTTDRLVTASLVVISPGQQPRVRTWLADPGVEIPAEASAVHGISTEHARAHGQPAAVVVAEVAEALTTAWNPDVPLCVFNAPFDLSLLAAELWRHHRREFAVTGPVVDPMCLDRHLDRYRKGKRHLEALCAHYQVRLDQAHTSAGDALACARLAWRLAQRFPTEVGQVPLAELHQSQAEWHREQTHSFAGYLDRLAARADDPAEAQKLRDRAAGERADADQWPARLPAVAGTTTHGNP